MPRKSNISDEMIISLYLKGAALSEISAFSGLSDRAIRNIMTKHRIRKRSIGQPRKHKVNEQFFKTWSNEMAWVLGLIFTDGCLNKKIYTLTIAQKNIEILKQIASVMEAEFIVSNNETPSLIINSKIIYNDLLTFGLSPNKSKVLEWPSIPELYLPHFIRGVIDGDGWIQNRGYVMNITSASKSFADELLNVFIKWGLRTEITKYSTKNETVIYRVWVKGKQSIAKLSDIIYNNVNGLYNENKKLRLTQWNEGV